VLCRELLRDDIIPYAIKWFTGEAQMEDSDDEEDEDAEDDEDDEVRASVRTGCSAFAVVAVEHITCVATVSDAVIDDTHSGCKTRNLHDRSLWDLSVYD